MNLDNFIDYAVLRQLRTDVAENFFPKLLEIFLSEGDQRVNKIEQAILENNLAALARETHSLKSESATFGAVKLSALASHINLLCHQGQEHQAFAEAKAVKSQWALVYQALQNQTSKIT